MTEWLYYGSENLQSDGTTLTLPVALTREEVIPGEEQANIFWFMEDEKRGFSDSLRDTSQLPDYLSTIHAGDGSRFTTVVKPCRVDKNGEPRFGPKQTLHFIATKEMANGEESSVYVLSTDQLLESVPSSEAWVRTQENLQRLFELAEIDRLEKLLPDELTGGEAQTGSGETVSFDSYRYQPGKGGFVEVDNDGLAGVVARWFRYEDGMNSAETESETYSLIESKFEILGAENKTLEQVGETEQFTVGYYKDLDDWAKESEDGSLDHVPRAIENALEDAGWTLKTS